VSHTRCLDAGKGRDGVRHDRGQCHPEGTSRRDITTEQPIAMIDDDQERTHDDGMA
jgi:hypothetical protein